MHPLLVCAVGVLVLAVVLALTARVHGRAGAGEEQLPRSLDEYRRRRAEMNCAAHCPKAPERRSDRGVFGPPAIDPKVSTARYRGKEE